MRNKQNFDDARCKTLIWNECHFGEQRIAAKCVKDDGAFVNKNDSTLRTSIGQLDNERYGECRKIIGRDMVDMRREIITISRGGRITVPANPQMADFEIAELFGVFASKVKANIRSLLKSNICQDECLDGGVVIGKTIYPLYYGLEMIVALSFRIDAANAIIFRKWVLKRIISDNRQQTILISLPQSPVSN